MVDRELVGVVTRRSVKFKFPRFISAITCLIVATVIALLLLASTPSEAIAQTNATDVDTLDFKGYICLYQRLLFVHG